MEHSRSVERLVIGLLLAVALATFFFPLLTIQVPILGTQDVSGYDIFSKIDQFRDRLAAVPNTSPGQSLDANQAPVPNVQKSSSPLPISLQTAWLIAVEVSVAFVCALLALFGCLTELRRGYVKSLSVVGGLAAVLAILHLTIINSDLHAWLQQEMQTTIGDLHGNPFAEFSQRIGGLVIGSFRIGAGSGLYALAIALVLVAFLTYSKILAGQQETDEAEVSFITEPKHEHGAKIVVGVILVLMAGGIGLALLYKQIPGTGTKSSREDLLELARSCPISHQWTVDFAGDGSLDRVEEHHCDQTKLSGVVDAKNLEIKEDSNLGYDFLLVIEPRSLLRDKVIHGEYEEGTYSSVEPMVFGSQNIHAMVINGEPWGSGGFASSCFLAQSNGQISCWKEQPGDIEKYIHRNVLSDESTGAWVLETKNGKLFTESNVWSNDDPHCCPTRGSIRVEFIPRDGVLYRGVVKRQMSK